MDPAFWPQVGTLTAVFVFAIGIGLLSRRMERGDMITLLVIVPVTFAVAVLPGIITWGFTKDSASYLVGAVLILLAAVLNRRFQPGRWPRQASGEARERAEVKERKWTSTT